ncbi:EtfA7: electron transfer flavoprotein, subunit alpha [Desulfosarcina variabilis str. Montpellier]|uniref:electron transfer flavoprotein subunit alpha/FixB family protein n=1 Tax=Desulfosarcina variabilis TaxID=2300 RepID=UPI003AFB7393
MQTTDDILIVLESINNRIREDAEAALGIADRLQDLAKGTARVLVLGANETGIAEEIATRSGYDVTVIADPALATPTHEAYRRILAREIQNASPTYVCVSHTATCAEWVPSVAVDIDAGCITGVDHIDCREGRICFYKDLYGGRVKGCYAATTATTLVTALPGMFQSPYRGGQRPGTVSIRHGNETISDTQLMGVLDPITNSTDFNNADVIVAAGMGIGSQENLKTIEQLAALFPKAAIGGTRLVCDQNWLGYDRQIGVTGATVSPALYLACGISGAVQHRMGMRGAGFVVAINTDPHAPIFNDADVCIVEDLMQFIPLVVDACQTETDDGNPNQERKKK